MKSIEKKQQKINSFAAIIVCAIGVWIISSVHKFSELGKIFPVIVGAGFVFCSLALFFSRFFFEDEASKILNQGILWRKVILMICILIWAFSLPIFGYLPTSIPAFFIIAMIVPRSSNLNLKLFLIILFSAVTVPLIIFAFLTLLLSVPLPEGVIFY